ncbi:multidrug DMT transporter permease [Streptomyces sp. NPDC051445]|uniref:multidrug DMT transporter permease n=1 Tax=Streptomyces sp. NPDC051445 TaxID=3365653 RepID=UPI003791295B
MAGGGAAGAARTGVRDGLVASAGVAVQYLALGQAGAAAGLWPAAAGRVAAVLVLLPGGVRRRVRWPTPALAAAALLIGAGTALGLSLFRLAARRELLAVAVVVASLCPALPVMLGLALLHERVGAGQALGLTGAAVATVLPALG